MRNYTRRPEKWLKTGQNKFTYTIILKNLNLKDFNFLMYRYYQNLFY